MEQMEAKSHYSRQEVKIKREGLKETELLGSTGGVHEHLWGFFSLDNLTELVTEDFTDHSLQDPERPHPHRMDLSKP